MSELTFSDGWLAAFKSSHRLRYRNRSGEIVTAGAGMNKTGLCYAMTPVRSICTKHVRGVKNKKTCITLTRLVSADGTDTLLALFAGIAKQLRFFEKRSAKEPICLLKRPG